MRLAFLSLLFIIISCNGLEFKSSKLKKEDSIRIESIIKTSQMNSLKAKLETCRDSINLKLSLTFPPITVADIKIDDYNVFIKQIGGLEDTIYINSILPKFKINRLKKFLFKKKKPQNLVKYSNQSFFISLFSYVNINDIYVPKNITFSSAPFKDTIKLELDYKSVFFR